MLRLVLLISVINFSYCYGGTIDPLVDDNQYIKYAQDFHCVGKLKGVLTNGNVYSASAVAIDDHRILTAAHIIENNKFCILNINNKDYAIYKFVYPKEFDRKKVGFADIAIGYSLEAFNLSFYPTLYKDKDEVNKVCCMSGYGLTGTFNNGAIISDDKKRAGSNVIDTAYADLLVCTASKHSEPNRTSLEFIIASGDSGGGLFIGDALAGINSCVLATDNKADSSYGDESCHTRVSHFIEWIQKNK
jgi:hypothetical protein